MVVEALKSEEFVDVPIRREYAFVVVAFVPARGAPVILKVARSIVRPVVNAEKE